MGTPVSKRRTTERVKYRATGVYTQKDAAVIGPELRRLTDKYGTASPEVIVDEARSRKSPLHRYIFKLSDADAAQQYRLDQATYMTRHIVEVVCDDASGEEVQVRPFIHVDDEDRGRGYTDRRAMEDEEVKDIRERQALNELRSFVRRFADLQVVRPIIKAARRILKQAKGIR